MPSNKKRINLTVPDNIYEALQQYKDENGLSSDATACLQLIVQQLKSRENSKVLFKFMRELPLETIMQGTKDGYLQLQEAFNQMSDEERKKLLPK